MHPWSPKTMREVFRMLERTARSAGQLHTDAFYVRDFLGDEEMARVVMGAMESARVAVTVMTTRMNAGGIPPQTPPPVFVPKKAVRRAL